MTWIVSCHFPISFQRLTVTICVLKTETVRVTYTVSREHLPTRW